MRLLRGEDLESVSRAVGITAARASHWRAQFLAAGQAGLKSRAPDARDSPTTEAAPDVMWGNRLRAPCRQARDPLRGPGADAVGRVTARDVLPVMPW